MILLLLTLFIPGGDSSSTEDFNPLWISEFKKTNAYEVWDRTTDPLLFDIVEPRYVSFNGAQDEPILNMHTDTHATRNRRLLLISACVSKRVSKT